jgi:phosphoribosylformimino-5-aminoimidazole carboxamide ribotide isomerase
VQGALVASVIKGAGVPCQVGGGYRNPVDIDVALEAGADRVVLGTALLEEPGRAQRLVERFGTRLAAALDVRDGHAFGGAWLPDAVSVNVDEAVPTLAGAGITTWIVTGIARDGSMAGPDLELMERIRAALPESHLIASGGIGSVDDVRRLADLGFDGAILGRALYEGRIVLADALAAVA